MGGPTKKLGLIGLAALKFIGYKQTDKHHDKLNFYIDCIVRKVKTVPTGWKSLNQA